ncbi:hypothetical protein LSAT2_011038 [Lamellibrachia satsuma]|nr:hypothetical protein LSAT2_011038 [Lamellibrachia satsuma]
MKTITLVFLCLTVMVALVLATAVDEDDDTECTRQCWVTSTDCHRSCDENNDLSGRSLCNNLCYVNDYFCMENCPA